MIAIIRWFIRLLNKESQSLSRYKKSHSHFLWYLGLDAVLSVMLIIGGFHFLGPSSWVAHEKFMLAHPGVIPRPIDKFLNYVSGTENIYWIGLVTGYQYTINHPQGDGDMITYLPKDSNPTNASQPKITIETYKNLAAYAMDVHPFIGINNLKLVTTRGTTVEFNKATMDYEIVTFKDKPEIVIIDYSASQLTTTLMKNAANLKLVG